MHGETIKLTLKLLAFCCEGAGSAFTTSLLSACCCCWLATTTAARASSAACLRASNSNFSILARSVATSSHALLSAAATALCNSATACRLTSFTASSKTENCFKNTSNQCFVYSPTDALVSCLKKTILKFTLNFTLKQL